MRCGTPRRDMKFCKTSWILFPFAYSYTYAEGSFEKWVILIFLTWYGAAENKLQFIVWFFTWFTGGAAICGRKTWFFADFLLQILMHGPNFDVYETMPRFLFGDYAQLAMWFIPQLPVWMKEALLCMHLLSSVLLIRSNIFCGRDDLIKASKLTEWFCWMLSTILFFSLWNLLLSRASILREYFSWCHLVAQKQHYK